MKIGYHAFIDEAGDDGLRTIKTAENAGASEWLVMSAILVKSDNADRVPDWGWNIVKSLGQHQIQHLHYAKLNDEKRLLACNELAKLPVRIFVLLSNKRNIEGYKNIRAEKARVNRTAWFYCWMSKLLLERVTAYCSQKCIAHFGEKRSVQPIFSDRGGVNIAEVARYFEYIRWQSENERRFDSRFDISWDVIDTTNFQMHPNKMRIGLQLADIAASAFFNGLEINPNKLTNAKPAIALEPRVVMGRDAKKYGFGVKLMPAWRIDRIHDQQKELLHFYRKI